MTRQINETGTPAIRFGWVRLSILLVVAALLIVGGITLAPAESFADSAGDVDKILSDNCVKCHGGKRKSAGLDLSQGRSALVNKASTQADGMVLVAPGSPDGSYMFLKVSGAHTDAGKGGQMPLGRDALSASQLQTIQSWISAGAK